MSNRITKDENSTSAPLLPNGLLAPVPSLSGCELMKCKYYVNGKCTDPNDWVNESGDAVCGLRNDAILMLGVGTGY